MNTNDLRYRASSRNHEPGMTPLQQHVTLASYPPLYNEKTGNYERMRPRVQAMWLEQAARMACIVWRREQMEARTGQAVHRLEGVPVSTRSVPSHSLRMRA